MKKIVLTSLAFVGFLAFTNAQNQNYSVKDENNVEYADNSVHQLYEYGIDEYGDPKLDAKLNLVLHNEIDQDIYVAGELIEMINTDGTYGQFCIGGMWGNCFNNLELGGLYPMESGALLPGNSSWGSSDYFLNLNPNPGATYKIRFVQKDASGNTVPNSYFTITYVYAGNMAVADIDRKAVAEVYPTVAKGFTNLDLTENAQVQVVNALGKTVKTASFKAGTHKLDLSGFAAGVYWISFKGESGKTSAVKVVVK